ncbi:MAG: hypothetical protein K1X83_05290 [Oligoflexia bacterium]|nr:hypothetical protein [Oligoflexia bacterium]
MKHKQFRITTIFALGLLVITPMLSGCAGHKTTTETTTEVRHDLDAPPYDGGTTVETTKIEQVTKDDNHKGFFGIIGDILALPFRAIGSIL